MQITHEQARKLIQFSLDGVLQAAEKATLTAHLQDCMDCRDYAKELKEVEVIILPLMKRQWSAPPIPLSIPSLTQRKSSTIQASKLLAIRSTVIAFVFVALFFSAWQFVASGPAGARPASLVIPLVPTPSIQTAQSTNTESTAKNCQVMAYKVQNNDTLASLADRFLVSEDEIMKLNQLKTDTVSTSMELMIPICNFTPTGTIHPATFTITYTPIIQLTTSTPVGKY
jgi:LysM domain/Putative zinc-finger